MLESNSKQFRMAAIKWLFVTSVMLFVQIIVFFVSAGHIAEPRPWLFFGAALANSSVGTIVQYKLNPRLLVHRLKLKREGSKLWDEILMRVSNLTVLIAVPAVAGLDIGRFQWSGLHVQFAVLGFAFFISPKACLTFSGSSVPPRSKNTPPFPL